MIKSLKVVKTVNFDVKNVTISHKGVQKSVTYYLKGPLVRLTPLQRQKNIPTPPKSTTTS
jgi:hypothetical protein